MTFAKGQRIDVRGENFLVLDVKPIGRHNSLIKTEGISELVRGKKFHFDTRLDKNIAVVNPAETHLVADEDYGYRKTKLFIETQVRNAHVFSPRISIAQKAAFNLATYQLEPTLKSLKLPRPRILIADGVGLGKTIEVGIFLAEQLKRGKKRIMVLALKSILGQFQQEIWNRFAIPLVRLDSEGIAQIRATLPANKNPFDFYDKTIVSIDTLKNNAKFRHYIEKSKWDIIVIDECHTVANAGSLRGGLAQFLATKCEALVLTSATPHNGRKESFANLINMIEPTAIPRSGDYDKSHVEPYYVRRFKNDILDDDVRANFQDREIVRLSAPLSMEEQAFLNRQQALKFTALSTSKEDFLFSIGIFKGYMSSPKAALATLKNRLEKVKNKAKNEDFNTDEVTELKELIALGEAVLMNNADSKYTKFKEKLLELKWSGRAHNDRLVVFAERLDTLAYLKEQLTADFKLTDTNLKVFHGGLTDMEQQAIVEDFGKEDSEVRMLLCSDSAAQGVNLHFYCHQMFNYDIPWSLITLEQRSGRIDRYGQKKTPFIYYLVADSDLEGLKTDLHIIHKLTEKEEEVNKTLGDVGSVMRLYDTNKEESLVEKAIKEGNTAFLETQEDDEEFDFSSLFGEETEVTTPIVVENLYENTPSIYKNDFQFYQELTEQLKSSKLLEPDDVRTESGGYLAIKNTSDMNNVLYDLPPQAKPKIGESFKLSLDKTLVQTAIDNARKKKGAWAEFQILYELHPVVRYLMTKLEASVDKDVALVAKISSLPPNRAFFVLHGQVSNQLGQSIISDFFVVGLDSEGNMKLRPQPLEDFINAHALQKDLVTEVVSEENLLNLKEILPHAIYCGQEWHMHQMQLERQDEMEKAYVKYREQVHDWYNVAKEQLTLSFADTPQTGFSIRRKEDAALEIKTILDESSDYFNDMQALDQEAFIKVIAVFYHF
jgi:ERCC4-related helicase